MVTKARCDLDKATWALTGLRRARVLSVRRLTLQSDVYTMNDVES